LGDDVDTTFVMPYCAKFKWHWADFVEYYFVNFRYCALYAISFYFADCIIFIFLAYSCFGEL